MDMDVEVDVDVNRHLGCLKRGFKASSGIVQWYRSTYGSDFENSEIASTVLWPQFETHEAPLAL